MSEEKFILDTMEDASVWSALNAYTDNVELTVNHVTGKNAMEFDKVAGGVGCGISRAVEFDLSRWNPEDHICWLVYASSVTNIARVSVSLGTSIGVIQQWRVADTVLTAGRFTLCSAQLGNAYTGGAGWNPRVVAYMSVSVTFDAAGNTLADVAIDEIYLRKSRFTQT